MTPEEIAPLIARMVGQWPTADGALKEQWIEGLEHVRDPDRADAIVDLVIAEHTAWPEWSEFSKAWQRVADAERRDDQVVPRQPEPPAPTPSAPPKGRISDRLTQAPHAGPVNALRLVEVLEEGWGQPVPRREDWIRRLTTQPLDEALGNAIDLAANAGRPIEWGAFVKHLNAETDKLFARKYRGEA